MAEIAGSLRSMYFVAAQEDFDDVIADLAYLSRRIRKLKLEELGENQELIARIAFLSKRIETLAEELDCRARKQVSNAKQ
jgi:hypothetical protein